MKTIHTWFTIISIHMDGLIMTLECNGCGEVFDVDFVNQINVICLNYNGFVPKCPTCGQEGEL